VVAGWFSAILGPFILWLQDQVSGPNAVWRSPLQALGDAGVWLSMENRGVIIALTGIAVAVWLVLRRRR
jgi:hypothetical protein